MAWVARQVVVPGPSCQMVSLVRWTASASYPPEGPGASVAVPAGRAGSDRHAAPGPVMVSARFPVKTTAAAPLGAKDAEASSAPRSRMMDDSAQWAPLPVD